MLDLVRGWLGLGLLAVVWSCMLDRMGGYAVSETTSSDLGGAASTSTSPTGSTSSAPGGSGTMSGMGGAGGGGHGGKGGGAPHCPGSGGPEMVLIEAASGSFCVDATEVTSAQYKAFVDTNPSKELVGPECAWKSSFAPKSVGNSCEPKHYDPIGLPNHPVACVDWCDAYAFCGWAGKRMCGAFGGGENPFDSHDDATKSEWFYACSAGDTQLYPYLGAYQPMACVGDDYDGVPGDGALDDASAVGTAGCEGGLSGLQDMSGNVWEWERSCQKTGPPQDQPCRDRGGSFWDSGTMLACGSPSVLSHTRDYYNKNIGFRCCADPLP